MNHKLRAGLFVLFAALSPDGSADSADREQPIHIVADSVHIDDPQGISVYSGNVVYTQGSIQLEADTVRLYYTRDRKIDRLEADGMPARFKQRIEGHDEDMRAQAEHVEYFAGPSRLILSRDAHVWRLNAEFSGDTIEYDAAQDRVSAAKAANAERRVQVIIQPEQEQKKNNHADEGDSP